MYTYAEAYQTTPQMIGNVEKSDKNQETQSQENAKNPLYFKHTEGGLKMYGSARFTDI